MKLNSAESIFTTIGDYPVVDQFDVLYSSLLSGSTNDNYVTGSLLRKIKSPSETTVLVAGERGLAFSKVGEKNNSIDISKSFSFESQPNKEKSGIIRNIRIFSDSERFYDSLVPNVSDVFSVLGGGIFTDQDTYDESFGILTFNSGSSLLFGEDITNQNWTSNFPFASIFNKVHRVKNIQNSLVSVRSRKGGVYFAKKKKVKIKMIVDYGFVNSPISLEDGLSRSSAKFIDETLLFGTKISLSNSDVSKIIFGFGDLFEKVSRSNIVYGTNSFANYRNNEAGNFLSSPVIRGWKYGLLSGLPTYSSAVFRRDRFGQLRDMLEQRLSSTTLVDYENSPSVSFDPNEGSPIPESHVNQSSPSWSNSPSQQVSIKFVRQSIMMGKLIDVPVAPENTQCSNLSIYATSSLPYFDGEVRSRGEITSISNPNSKILNLKTDIFGNTVI